MIRNRSKICILTLDKTKLITENINKGNLKEIIMLPQTLAWSKPSDCLWLDLDHHIYKYSLTDKKFTEVLALEGKPISH